MTPTLAEILHGNFVSLSTPATPDMAGEFMATRIGAIALLNLLASQEAERGSSAVMFESRSIRALLAEAKDYVVDIPPAPADPLPAPAAIDADNAALRRALIRLHEAVDLNGDAALETRILRLYRRMAEGRRLIYPTT